MIRLHLLLLFVFLTCGYAQAQVKIISGKTLDKADNSPLPGVSIMLKGSKKGVQSDAKGNFTLDIGSAAPATLIVNYVGYNTQQVEVGNKTQLDVYLVQADNGLNEVVVVGYGTQKKVNLTGSVASISSAQITNRPVTSMQNALQGITPGLTVKSRTGDVGSFNSTTGEGGAGGDIGSLSLRGSNQITLAGQTAVSKEPLIVVDGIPASPADFARINPNDVESISVLKDAASASIYGNRAANGVILVTTKKGKDGKMNIEYNGYYGQQSPTNIPKYLGSPQYARLLNEALTNAGRPVRFTEEEIRKFDTGEDPDKYPNTDWYKASLLKNAPLQDHQISVSGGDKIKFYSGFGYMNQESLKKGKDMDRYSFRLNTNAAVNKRLNLSTTSSFTQEMYQMDGGDYSFTTLNRNVPTIPIRHTDGTWGSLSGGVFDPLVTGNTVRTLEEGGWSRSKEQRINTAVNADLTLIEGLTLRGTASYNAYNKTGSAFTNELAPIINFLTKQPVASTAVTPNALDERWDRNNRMLLQGTAEYEKTIGKHYGKILGGTSYEAFQSRFIRAGRKDFPNNDLGVIDAGANNPNFNTNEGNLGEWAIQSFFGRMNYSYNDRYLLEANIRFDKSSRFGPANRLAVFPGFSAGWRISQEEFMKQIKWIDDLKIRASWGKLGNQDNVGNYDYLDLLVSKFAYSFADQTQNGVWQEKGSNSKVSWEKTTVSNLGMDLTMFNGKVNLTADYYLRNTNDILLSLQSALEYGLDAPAQNAGSVQNKGLELQLGYKNNIGGFTYGIGANMAKVWNKITSLSSADGNINDKYIFKVGEPLGSFYMYKSQGLFASDAEAAASPKLNSASKGGDIKFADLNGDNKIDANDRTIVGNDQPFFTYGFNMNMAYKGFDFSMLAQGVTNVKVYLGEEASMAFFNGSGVKPIHEQRWTIANPDPNAAYPRLLKSENNTQNTVFSDFWLFNAAYLRIKSMSLGYTFNAPVISKMHLGGLRVYLSATNPFTVRADKRLKDFDPEVPSARSSYPGLKSYVVGLSVRF